MMPKSKNFCTFGESFLISNSNINGNTFGVIFTYVLKTYVIGVWSENGGTSTTLGKNPGRYLLLSSTILF